MKQHTQRFKEVITELGKQQDVIITYTIDGKRVELGVEEINSATPRFSSNLLKSVMKELHLDSNVDIPLETEINFKYGLLVDGEFEYLDYGNYIVYSSEKKEDTASYEIVCYDKMLYSMKEYEELAIFYPCTVRSYINAIAGKLGLDFANKNDTFVNYDKELVGDFYLSTDEETQEKKSMGYTYRDVLDDLAEVTASVICINDKDELEVRYITDSINYETTEKSKELKVESEIESQIKILELDGASIQDGTPTPETPVEIQSVGDDVNLLDIEDITFTTSHAVNVNLKAGTYTFTADVESNDTDSDICRAYFYNGSTSLGSINLSRKTRSSATIELTDSVTKIELYASYGYNVSKDDTATFAKIKLQKGTIATAYSEYGKGTVEIKQCGKNLAYDGWAEDFVKRVNNSSQAKIETKDNRRCLTYVCSVGYNDYDNKYLFKTKWKENTQYTIQFDINVTVDKCSNFSIEYTDNTRSLLNLNITAGTWQQCTITTDINKTVKYIRANYQNGYTHIDLDTFMIKEGTVITEYEEYKGNNYVIPLSQPLRSLPNGVKDTIEADGIHRRVGSVVLDGSEDWNKASEVGQFYTMDFNNVIKPSSSLYCSHLKVVDSWGIDNSVFVSSSSNIGITISSITTVIDLKSWLQENPITVQCELIEEVIEPFDEEQQSVIDSIKTFEGINIINSDAELQIKYPINKDTINEEYLKDTNVTFGEKYGPINAVVLSRSAESDNIYLRDEESVFSNGLYEIKITDNQIMNQNNRDIYIQDIFDKLKGIEYYLHDLSSTGIMYYNLLDKFDVKIADKIYPIVLFNDEQNISQGLEETLYAELSETTETDYKKAGKDDLKVSLIVDKQNKSINAVVKSNSELEDKTAQLRIDVDRIEGQISETADVTSTGEGYGTVELENINGDSEPIYIRVYPTNEDIISLKPKVGLYPSVGLYPHSREIHFKNTSSQEPYEVTCNIPSDLYQLNDIHDEFILKYETQECYVIHRIGIDKNGNKYVLDLETIEYFDYPVVPLTEGDYQIYTPLSNMAYIYVRLMVQNIYTTQFATKVEVNSKIEQTSNSITSSVNQTLTNYDTKTEVNSKISQTANEINSEVRKKVGEDEIISKINQSAEQVQINANKISLARKNSKFNWR